MKRTIKRILPCKAFIYLKRIFKPANVEFRWINYTRKKLKNRIKKELIITKNGEFFLRSDFGFDFLLDTNNPYLQLDTFDDLKFKALLEYLKELLPENPVIIDVGAFAGGYSLAITKYFPKATIFCFEPVYSSYEKLITNIKRNQKENFVHPYRYAISERSGTVNMTSDLTTGNHIITTNEKNYYASENIPSISLDNFIVENNITNVNFIKCDVEGHELSVISGAEQLINKYRPVIYVEVQKEWTIRYGYNPIDLMKKMKDYGYGVFIVGHASIEAVDDLEKAIAENENFLFKVN